MVAAIDIDKITNKKSNKIYINLQKFDFGDSTDKNKCIYRLKIKVKSFQKVIH